MKKFLPPAFALLVLASQTLTQAQAQMGSPIPGSDSGSGNSQTNQVPQTNLPPTPGLQQIPQTTINAPSYVSAPVPGQAISQPYQGSVSTSADALSAAGKSRYQQLPISPNDAQVRLQELTNQISFGNLAANTLKDIQQNVLELADWLNDLTDAHYRMYTSFSKSQSTRRQAEAEKITFQDFRSLKFQAQLLKAQLLIKQNRIPEALGPLVDVVVAEPQTATGQSAYKLLKDIGFSQEASNVVPQAKAELPQAQVETAAQDPLVSAKAPTAIEAMPQKAPSKVAATKVKRLPPSLIPPQPPTQFQLRKGR